MHNQFNYKLLKEIIKCDDFNNIENDKEFIDILCKDENINKFMLLFNENHITIENLNIITQNIVHPFTDFDNKLSFFDYAYFTGNVNIINHFSYDPQFTLSDIQYRVKKIFENIDEYTDTKKSDFHNFIVFYNQLPDNNLIDTIIPSDNLYDNIWIQIDVLSDIHLDCENHCKSIGGYGYQYNMNKINYCDNVIKFLLKSNSDNVIYLENLLEKCNEKNNKKWGIRSCDQNIDLSQKKVPSYIMYLIYKNFYNSLNYILNKYPEIKEIIIILRIFKTQKVMHYLIKYNIQTIITLIDHDITSFYDIITDYLYNHANYVTDVYDDIPIYISTNLLFNVMKRKNICPPLTTLIDQQKLCIFDKVYEYIQNHNKFIFFDTEESKKINFTTPIVNDIMLCYTHTNLLEHFRNLSQEHKAICLKFLLEKNEYELLLCVMYDDDIKINQNIKLKILVHHEMYDEALEFLCDPETDVCNTFDTNFQGNTIHKISNHMKCIDTVMNIIQSLLERKNGDMVFKALTRMNMNEHLINLIKENKSKEYSNICKYITEKHEKYLQIGIGNFIDEYEPLFPKSFNNLSRSHKISSILNKFDNCALNLCQYFFDENKEKVDNVINDNIDQYCYKYMNDLTSCFAMCHAKSFIDSFNKLSISMKNNCLTYLLDINNDDLLSKIILDNDITNKIDDNTKFKILVNCGMWDEVYNLICNYECIRELPPILINSYESMLDDIMKKSAISININPLLTYICKNNMDVMKLLNALFPNINYDDKLMIIKNLPKELNNYCECVVQLCDSLINELVTYCNIMEKKIQEEKIKVNKNIVINDSYVMYCNTLEENANVDINFTMDGIHNDHTNEKDLDKYKWDDEYEMHYYDNYQSGNEKINDDGKINVDIDYTNEEDLDKYKWDDEHEMHYYENYQSGNKKINVDEKINADIDNEICTYNNYCNDDDVEKIDLNRKTGRVDQHTIIPQCTGRAVLWSQQLDQPVSIINNAPVNVRMPSFTNYIKNELFNNIGKKQDFDDLVKNHLASNPEIVKFVNEFDLSHQLKNMINVDTDNFLIKNIITQNMLNKGNSDTLKNLEHKLVIMTSNIYKQNHKNLENVINNSIRADYEMISILFNYTQRLPKIQAYELDDLQRFLRSIQNDNNITDDLIYEYLLMSFAHFTNKSNNKWTIEYFISKNFPKCLNLCFETFGDIQYDSTYVNMAKNNELLSILIKFKNRFEKSSLHPIILP